jgi:vacuole morphology and inheritance protein 14
MIDSYRDIYVNEIENINFEFHELAQNQIDLVCMLSRKNENLFREIMEKLIQRFHYQKRELDKDIFNKITLALCTSIKPEKVFMEFATIFHKMTDLDFVYDMIETLTFGIAASPFYKALRGKLSGSVPTDFAKDKEDLFVHLFDSWCINPISTLTLCLLSQKYELAYNLINKFTDELDSKKLI